MYISFAGNVLRLHLITQQKEMLRQNIFILKAVYQWKIVFPLDLSIYHDVLRNLYNFPSALREAYLLQNLIKQLAHHHIKCFNIVQKVLSTRHAIIYFSNFSSYLKLFAFTNIYYFYVMYTLIKTLTCKGCHSCILNIPH